MGVFMLLILGWLGKLYEWKFLIVCWVGEGGFIWLMDIGGDVVRVEFVWGVIGGIGVGCWVLGFFDYDLVG